MSIESVRVACGVPLAGRYACWAASPPVYSTQTGGTQSLPWAKEAVNSTYQANLSGTGSVSATVQIQVTNDPDTYNGTSSNWVLLGTITLSGTNTASDGFASNAAWAYCRANCTAISGTGATLEVALGV